MIIGDKIISFQKFIRKSLEVVRISIVYIILIAIIKPIWAPIIPADGIVIICNPDGIRFWIKLFIESSIDAKLFEEADTRKKPYRISYLRMGDLSVIHQYPACIIRTVSKNSFFTEQY